MTAYQTRGAFWGRILAGACVLAILAVCLVAGNYVQATVNQLKSTHQVFNDRQLRNGYVAMSDIQRLVLVLQEALSAGRMTPEAAADFQAAADFLYVRTDNFRRVLGTRTDQQTARQAIAQLEVIGAIADDAIAADFDDLDQLWIDLTEQSQQARQALVIYMDEMRRLQDALLLKQSLAVERQLSLLWTTLGGLTVLGIAAIVLLRREVMSRRARQVAEERVHHLAFFDSLTGLPNRVQFQDRMSALLNGNAAVTLLLVDLDDFKLVNDTHGHAAGDAILRHVSKTLSRIVQDQDAFCARLGGDEFSVLIQSDDLDRLIPLCERIINDVGETIQFEGEALAVNASIGLATNTQIGAEIDVNVDSLFRVADFALYASKSNGRKIFTIYDKELEQQFLDRRAMVDELPRAITDGSMEFFLQPKVLLNTEETYGFEALVRWRRNGEIVPPQIFIATAEESGVITDLDCHVLRQASRKLAQFNARHGTEFSVSINFSALHFNSDKLVGVIAEALEYSGLRPDLLTIEITESVEMRDWDKAKQIIAGIHNLGAKIAIDDFGAGFSSLAYLRKTVADEIKIDRSLIEDIESSDTSRFLLDSVLDIAHNLKFAVTVEGIETAQQARIVSEMGAGNAQGYYFGRPLPADEALSIALDQNVGTSRAAAG